MPFCNLLGNELAKAALQRMADQKTVPNTLLFAGPDGVGKSCFALKLAALLMGERHHAKILSGNHPDVHIYLPEGKGSLHPIDAMRKLIDEVGMPPFEAAVKVFIIHDAHQMLPASSNALLKTFEEPNLDSYIILLSDKPELLLPTIVSRCRRIPFFPIADSLISDHLVQQHQKTSAEAERVALLSHGSIGKALQLMADTRNQKREVLIELLTCDIQREYPRFLKLCTQLEETLQSESEECEDGEEGGSSHKQVESLFEEILAWYRDLHLIREGVHSASLYYRDHEEELKRSAHGKIPSMEQMFERIETCQLALQRHSRLRVVLENLFLR